MRISDWSSDVCSSDLKLVRTLSRERAKDMATDYAKADPARSFAERRGITFRERVAEIVRQAPEKARGMFDGLRLAIGGQGRKSVGEGKRVSGRVDLGGCRHMQKKTNRTNSRLT